jgi:hypothetical protein
MGAATIRSTVALGSHVTVVVNHGVENGRQHATMRAAIVTKPVQHELGDRSVPDQVGPAQDLKVPRYGGLRQLQNRLQVGDEEGRGGETVQDPEPGGLRNRHQEVRR